MQSISRAPLVVSTETAGLGNRIKSWVSAMRLGTRARVLWALNEDMPAGFRVLLANDCGVYVPLFRSVVVQPSIAARVADFAARLDDDVIGVQIRTWRDDPRRYRKYHLPSVRRLARLLDAAPATSRFLVVSDADEIIGELA